VRLQLTFDLDLGAVLAWPETLSLLLPQPLALIWSDIDQKRLLAIEAQKFSYKFFGFVFLSWLWLWWCWHEAVAAAGQLNVATLSFLIPNVMPRRVESSRIASHGIARNPFQSNGLRLYRVQFISSVFHVAPWLKLKTRSKRFKQKKLKTKTKKKMKMKAMKQKKEPEEAAGGGGGGEGGDSWEMLAWCCLCDFSFGSGHARIACWVSLTVCVCVCLCECLAKAKRLICNP